MGTFFYWHCWLDIRKGIQPVKNWVVGCWRGCLGWGADLHIAQQMSLPLTISCSSKSRLVSTFLVLPFWYLLTRVVPDIFQKSSKTVVCLCNTVEYVQKWSSICWMPRAGVWPWRSFQVPLWCMWETWWSASVSKPCCSLSCDRGHRCDWTQPNASGNTLAIFYSCEQVWDFCHKLG